MFFQAEYEIRVAHMVGVVFCSFFFQAEDGIRDSSVTGVQTCALPISPPLGDAVTETLRRRSCVAPAGGDRVLREVDELARGGTAQLLGIGEHANLAPRTVDRKSVV